MRSGIDSGAPGWLAIALGYLVCLNGAFTQPRSESTRLPPPRNWTADEDHRNMMEELGIRSLRPGPSGNESAPNHANYDETAANPFPNLPDPLKLKDEQRVTNAATWWNERRPEIVEDFEREVYGRVPPQVPKVNWIVTSTTTAVSGSSWRPVIEKQLVGRVDNSSYPLIDVNIQMTLVVPMKRYGRVPVMIMFGRGVPNRPLGSSPPPSAPSGDPPAAEQLIAAGWGYAYLNPTSVQADNGAGLTTGIIGLVNKGQARKPDDWGALRAWAWGASRALDYLETDPAVDARRIGIEGVSRYGKAALVTMAFDTRFAVVLVGSSGEGGAKLHRRNWGEAVENLTATGEYHWMAGNFLKYGAAEAVFGSRNAGDLPVDAHELIALCAPRPTFISYGVPEQGDAKWLDQQGSFMATVAAGPVFWLLGAEDLGIRENYHSAKMPAVNAGLLSGQLAWRQHDGGHTDAPNWRYFIPWADRFLKSDEAVPRTDENSRIAHKDLLAKARTGRIDVYFEGDSITRRWGATDYPELLANWKQNFFGWNVANFGWGGDTTRNILWRLNNGELDGINPKVLVLLAGTNDLTDRALPEDDRVAGVTRRIQEILHVIESKAPEGTIVLMGIFPRNDDPKLLPIIKEINTNLSGLADGSRIRYLNINDRLADPDGRLFDGMMNSRDKLHPTVKGYQVWADALKPLFTELLGPPGADDQAPPPTGDRASQR